MSPLPLSALFSPSVPLLPQAPLPSILRPLVIAMAHLLLLHQPLAPPTLLLSGGIIGTTQKPRSVGLHAPGQETDSPAEGSVYPASRFYKLFSGFPSRSAVFPPFSGRLLFTWPIRRNEDGGPEVIIRG